MTPYTQQHRALFAPKNLILLPVALILVKRRVIKMKYRKFLKISLVVFLVALFLVEFNYALGIDFRLRRKFKRWDENAEVNAVFFDKFKGLDLGGENLDPRQWGFVQVGDLGIRLYDCWPVCINGDDIYFINYQSARHYQLLSYNTADETLALHFNKSFYNYTYYLDVIEGLRSEYQDPSQLFRELYHERGCEAACFNFGNEIVLQNGAEVVVYNVVEDTVTEKEGIYCPDAMVNGIKISEEGVEILRADGTVKTLTLQEMAKMEKTAKELYTMSKHLTSIFGPKITVKFSRAGSYGDDIFIALEVSDSGGWPHVLYYLYSPEDDTLQFLHWFDAIDPGVIYYTWIIPEI